MHFQKWKWIKPELFKNLRLALSTSLTLIAHSLGQVINLPIPLNGRRQ